jgi:hypothetical protein
MNPAKVKAEDLIEQFENYSHTDFNYSRGGYQFDSQLQNAKQCALIAVNEILNNFGSPDDGKLFYASSKTIAFYQEVKQELENFKQPNNK